MSTLLFVAQVSGDAASGYQGRFPDLPDCTVDAANLAAFLVEARASVLKSLQALSNAGEAWPIPTAIEEVAAKPGTFPILVDVTVEDAPVRVNISIGEKLLQRLDAAAEARSMTRSGYIAHAVRVSLGERPSANAEFEILGNRLQDELNSLGRRINDSLGPDSAFTRRINELDGFVIDGVRKAANGVSAAMSRRQESSESAP